MWRWWSCRTGIAQELVDACGLMGLVGAFLQTRGVASGLGVQARRGAEIAVALVEVSGDGAATRDVVGNLGQRREPGRGAVGLADRNGPVEPDDRRIGEPEQLVIPADDLKPISLLHPSCIRVERGDPAWA